MKAATVLALLFASVAIASPVNSGRPGSSATHPGPIGPNDELPAGCEEPPTLNVAPKGVKCPNLHCEVVFCAPPELLTTACWCPTRREIPACPETCCPSPVMQHPGGCPGEQQEGPVNVGPIGKHDDRDDEEHPWDN